MNNYQICCQTITWGDEQHERFSEVFSEVANAGFDGVEIGWRRAEKCEVDTMQSMLAKCRLELVATHVGGNLVDSGQAKGEWFLIDQIINYLTSLKAKYMMFSGLVFRNHEQFEQDFDTLMRVERRCSERGIKLLYHNHNWEFQHGGLVIDRFESDDIFCCVDGLPWAIGKRSTSYEIPDGILFVDVLRRCVGWDLQCHGGAVIV